MLKPNVCSKYACGIGIFLKRSTSLGAILRAGANEERFAHVQEKAVKCPLALDGMQRSSNGGNTAGDQVSVICLHGEIAAEDMFDCIARDIVFVFGYLRPFLFCIVHDHCSIAMNRNPLIGAPWRKPPRCLAVVDRPKRSWT